MLPIYHTPRDTPAIDALRAKLSLKPLLLEGIDDETPDQPTSKFQTVRAILRDIQKNGDAALITYTQKFDKTLLTPATLRVPASTIEAAVKSASLKFLAALDVAIKNLRHYQQAMLTKEPASIALPGGGVEGGSSV